MADPLPAMDAVAIAPSRRLRAALAPLPVAALRLPGEAVEGLEALGLGTIGEMAGVPRGQIARRFGVAVLRRLDQALGVEPEPVSPLRARPVFSARLTLPEPIGLTSDVMAGLERLLERVCADLARAHEGARRMRLIARRVDASDALAEIRLARPMRDPMRLRDLFQRKVAEMEAGFGIDALRLVAVETEPLKPVQTSRQTEAERLDDLISRIGNRIGFERVTRLLPNESHIPERAFTVAAAAWSEAQPFPPALPRPLVLVAPFRLAVEAGREPPARFPWRGQRMTVRSARGPERIAPEWWWDDPAWRSGARDYWQVQTEEGPRLWLYRSYFPAPQWWVHGVFA
ncbi:MAG: DNA polymerase Y family protein [Pseudomonadota bacterium]